MASVFLSYDRDDATKASSIAQALEKAGHSVWWDRHIKGGSRYAAEIEKALSEADAVVVLWSHQSVQSDWVRDEAAKGRDSGRLVPARIDDAEPPLGFGQHQTTDLSRFRGRASSPQFRDLLEAIEGILSGGSLAATGSNRSGTRTRPSFSRAAMAAIVAAIVLIGGYLGWSRFGGQPRVPTVAVAPANSSAAASALSQDLLSKLGELQSRETNAIRLADAADVERVDLLFKVSGSLQTRPAASLSLVSGKDGGILWSGTFEQPSGRAADLKQQLAFSAARILGCATDGLSFDGERLDQQMLKRYLNACAQSAELMRADPTSVVRMMSQVVKEKPDFKPAWAKLLMAESEITGQAFNDGEPARQALAAHRRHIEQARQVDPGMAEVALAEAMLLPPREFARRIKLVEETAANDPDNANVQSVLAGAMFSTGRSREAISAARRALELDPLSPAMVNGYISALAYAGATDAAKRELAAAEKLWPGTASIRDAQWRFHVRYGDPRIAKAIFEQESDGDGRGWPIYLAARINPNPVNVERLMTYVGKRMDSMSNPSAGVGFATLAYGQFGRMEDIFKMLLSWDKPDDLATMSDVLFRPELQKARRDPRFMRLADRAGLVDYWRSSGKWPDFCFEADHSYDCNAEAAKLAA